MPKSMNVECPACGAKIEEPCQTLTGKAMPESHAKRKRAALERKHPREEVNQAAPSPHLIEDGNVKRCSVCKQPFFPDSKPSVIASFAKHVLMHHQPGQTTEDVN